MSLCILSLAYLWKTGSLFFLREFSDDYLLEILSHCSTLKSAASIFSFQYKYI